MIPFSIFPANEWQRVSFWLRGCCLVSNLSRFLFQGEEFMRFSGKGGGAGRRRWYPRDYGNLSYLGRCSGISLQSHRTRSRSLKTRKGLFKDARCSQASWLEVHCLEQCLNQVVGQFQQRPHGHHHWRTHLTVHRHHAGCWVPEIPPWEPGSQMPSATILARKWFLPDAYF